MSTVMPDPILPTAGASTPIADYGLLADCNGSALVDRAGAFEAERRYIPGSLAIETTFRTDKGMVRLTDVMAAAEGQRGHDLGFDAPHELLRAVEGAEGEVELVLELAPRPEHGLIMPLIRLEEGGARTFGSGRIGVRSSAPLEVADSTMRAG